VETDQIIWIIVAVVVVLALLALLAALARKRKATQDRHHAESLRQEAHSHQGMVQQEELRAREAEAEAERKRVEAERAESAATEARQAHLQEHARVEDQVREADRVDPDVDHRSEDYQPGTTGTTTGAGSTDATGTTGTQSRAAEDPVHQPPTDEPGTGGTHRH